MGRLSWPLPTVRALADKLLELADGRRKNAPHEARWLNLTGFCLRPGFGFPGDDFRIEQARRIYAGGITFGNQVQCEIDWWIFCGRIAGGLNRNQQGDIFQRLLSHFAAEAEEALTHKSKPLPGDVAYRGQPRTSAAADQSATRRSTARNAEAGRDDRKWRYGAFRALGARKLFSGPINLVVSPQVAGRWVDAMLRLPHTPALLEAVVQMARITGDTARDLAPGALEGVRKACEASPRAADLLRQLAGEGDDLAASSRVFGEELPAGIVLVESVAQ